MSKSRQAILNRLRRGGQQGPLPSPWLSRREYHDLAGQFSEALTAGGGEVKRARDLAEALDHVGTILEEIGARKVLVDDGPPLEEIDLANRYPGIDWHIAGRSQGDLRAFAAEADLGLGIAEAALAETGTVAIGSGPRRSRLTGLLPPVHLVLVPVSRLTADLFTWTADLGEKPPAALTLVSGPSKTSDIEQILVTGVHGPRRFIAILLEQDST